METIASEVSASEILGGTPPQKKSRPPLPPGVTVKPVYPGASYGIHPVDKMGIKLTDAKLLETPLPAGSMSSTKPVEQSTPTPTTPPPAPLDPAKPQETPQPEIKKEPQPQPGPLPDFSDLPGESKTGDQAEGGDQQHEPTPEQLHTAYGHMAGMFWDSIIRLLAAMFGDFWLPKTADERKMVIDSFVSYFDSVAMAALSPLQNLWAAIGLYALPRMPQTFTKIISWWKGRKNKRSEPQPEKGESAAHNFAGVNVEKEPINVESEITMRGPGV